MASRRDQDFADPAQSGRFVLRGSVLQALVIQIIGFEFHRTALAEDFHCPPGLDFATRLNGYHRPSVEHCALQALNCPLLLALVGK